MMEDDTQARSASRISLSRIKSLLAFRESGVLAMLVVTYVVMWNATPIFRSTYNQMTILRQMTVVAVVAIGQTMVIISGGFDLSQGPIAALVGMLCGWGMKYWGFSPIFALAFGLAIGLGAGLLNGWIVTRLRFEPAVATLASSSVFAGIMYFVTQGITIHSLPDTFNWLGYADIGRVPVAAIAMFLLYLIMHWVLTQTAFGRHVFIIGCNKEAARLAGINVRGTQVGIFAISGFLSGLAGIMLTGRITSAVVTMAAGLMVPTVAAAIIGGTGLTGGVGSMAGTLMGAAIMAILRNAIVVLRIDIYWQEGVVGLVTVLAVLIDQLRHGKLSLPNLLAWVHRTPDA